MSPDVLRCTPCRSGGTGPAKVGDAVFDLWVKGEEEHLEVSSIRRLADLTNEASKEGSPQSGARREVRPSEREQPSKRWEPDGGFLIEGAPPGHSSNAHLRSHAPECLDGLLRHRLRSISSAASKHHQVVIVGAR